MGEMQSLRDAGIGSADCHLLNTEYIEKKFQRFVMKEAENVWAV